MKKIAIWAITKLVVLLLTALLAPKFIPYGGVFAHPSVIKSYNLSQFIYSLANFDGAHYLHIVQEGYHEFDQAFFPLYPLLIKKTAIFFANNHLITGLFISNLSFIIGCILFYKLLKDQMNQQQAWLAIIALFLFPTSFYFQAVYTEGLFFFLVMASLYAFFRKNYFLSAIFSYFAALTRFVGVFLFVSYLFSFLAQEKKLTS
jgi:Gpi18-like mannosyltransferase